MNCRIKQGLRGRWFIFHPQLDDAAWSGMRWVSVTEEGFPTGGVQVCDFATRDEATQYLIGVHAGEETHGYQRPDITLPNELTLTGEIVGKPAGFKPVLLGWKDEGDVGKVWVEDVNGDCASATQWITRGAARKLAKKMGLPFEERDYPVDIKTGR